MAETAEQYKERFRSYVAGKIPIVMQREAPRTLASLIENVTVRPIWLARPAPGKWSVTEILAHLAEDELAQLVAVSPDARTRRRVGLARL